MGCAFFSGVSTLLNWLCRAIARDADKDSPRFFGCVLGTGMLIGAACFEDGDCAASLLRERVEGIDCQNAILDNGSFAVFSTFEAENLEENGAYWRLTDSSRRTGISVCDSKDTPSIVDTPSWGRWCEFGYHVVSRALRIRTDALGLLYVFYVQDGRRTFFSTDFGIACRLARGRLTIDRESLLCELSLGYAPGNETIFQEIRLIPPGTEVSISASGTNFLAKRTLSFGDSHFGLSTEEKFRKLDDLIDSSLVAMSSSWPSDYSLSLSAGYDSRYILASLDRFGRQQPHLLTFGEPESMECRNAMAIAKKAGSASSVFVMERASWAQWLGAIQSLGNTGLVQWCGWSEDWFAHIKRKSDAVYIGFLGDALSGKHLGRTAFDSESEWLMYWMEWSTDFGWRDSALIRPGIRQAIASTLKSRFESARAEAGEMASPHQIALYLDLYGRQRRWAGAQPHLMSYALTPLLFFYQLDLMNFWANLPYSDLQDQNLYLSYAKARFPRFFPKSEKHQRTRWMRLASRVRSISNLIPGTQAATPILPINTSKIVIQNRSRILGLVDEFGEEIDDLIDVSRLRTTIENFPNGSDVTAGHVIRITNLLMLNSLRQ